jgi:hypothetical protein
MRFWVFRAGHYRGITGDHAPPDMPRWFMHGLYG